MRRFIFWLVSLFYPVIDITGQDNLPASGGMIIVSNHPNGIIDPIPLMIKLERPIAFLAKSTLWAIPLLRSFLVAFNALPIFRHRDDGLRHGPTGDAPARNEKTFALARKIIKEGGALALFPEGTTHSESQLLPLKTGAARIALQNEADMNWAGQVSVVPIGLWYENKVRFRSSILLVVGRPFTLDAYQASYLEGERETVRLVTEKIEEGLHEVVLQAESREILRALPVIANWLNNRQPPTLKTQHVQLRQLLATYERIKQQDPERLDSIVEAMRRYDGLLRAMGMADPWQPDLPKIPWWQLFGRVLVVVLVAPFALLGLLVSVVPYRLTRFVARRAIQDDYTQLSLAKIVGGLLFFLLTWIGLTIWTMLRWTVGWGVLFFVAIPILILITLWWVEKVRTFMQRLTRMGWLGRKGAMRKYVIEQQSLVVKMITDAVRDFAD